MKNIYCIAGKSGVGKTTCVDLLAQQYGYTVLKSYTTRSPRNLSDNDHIYISQEEYDALENKVATRVQKDGSYCATQEQVDASDLYVVDIGGYIELEEKYHGTKNIYLIYLDCGYDVSILRMAARGDDLMKIASRVEMDANTNNPIDVEKYADFIVDCNTNTIDTVCKIINACILAKEGVE